MRNRSRLLATAIMLAGALIIFDARQALAWRVGNWTGSAYGNRATGELSYCEMWVRYNSGIVLWFRQYANRITSYNVCYTKLLRKRPRSGRRPDRR